jgi:predicted dehydrogenase
VGDPHGIAVVGLGFISRVYLETLARHPSIDLVAVADLDAARAEAVAAEYGAKALSVDDAVAHPRVQTVLNLTIPAAHADIALRAIAAGKHVYGEKPLASTLDDARRVIDAAARAGVRIGCAPDTVLGTGIQTARAAVDRGLIGRPIAASATWIEPGHERWHPNPDFYYAQGGGPLFDMGPYYLTSLVHILGPVVSVVGASSRMRDARTIASGPRTGEDVPVDVATHVTGVLEHASGALSTVTMSFDGVRTGANPIEIHGERGSLVVPDPNHFDGTVSYWALGDAEQRPVEARAGFESASRGVGLIDFVNPGPNGARASGELALHVLEIMTGLLASADDGRRHPIASSATRPAPVPFTPVDEWAVRV